MIKQVAQTLVSPTTIGCVLCVAIGLTDIWAFHQLGELARTLLYVGLGGLLGYSIPTIPATIRAASAPATPPTHT